MSGEAGDIPGLDPAINRAPPSRARWGRRSPGRPDAGFGSDRGGATYAALDLGTNNCRLLVARPSGEGFRVVDAFSRIVRLGEGVSASGQLSEPAIARAIAALAICRNKMKNKGVTRARLIATEACRAAQNGVQFLARVADELGLELEVIDRETEARLAATGCTPGVRSAAGRSSPGGSTVRTARRAPLRGRPRSSFVPSGGRPSFRRATSLTAAISPSTWRCASNATPAAIPRATSSSRKPSWEDRFQSRRPGQTGPTAPHATEGFLAIPTNRRCDC